jgi:hypothetical protein
MPTASWALQTAIHSALTTDVGLSGLLGGERMFDHVPRGTPFPYITVGQTTERDWSTGGAEGGEHVFTLHIWSQARGRRQVQAIAAAIRGLLHDSELSLDGHRLINLRHEFTEVRRETDGETLRGLVRFRAVTEPL